MRHGVTQLLFYVAKVSTVRSTLYSDYVEPRIHTDNSHMTKWEMVVLLFMHGKVKNCMCYVTGREAFCLVRPCRRYFRELPTAQRHVCQSSWMIFIMSG